MTEYEMRGCCQVSALAGRRRAWYKAVPACWKDLFLRLMTTIEYPDLPVTRHKSVIEAALRTHQVVVVVGETGSGKTTQLPKMALEIAGDECKGRVGCTQPRRIAAASVARRVAEEMKCELGSLVGYQVRFEDKISEETLLKFMTDGILLAEMQKDPDLRQYHTIILDEAHERSLNIDFLLGYLKLLTKRRKDLRILISSATMDAGGFSEFFDDAPVINVEGRTFPVDIHYLPPAWEDEELPDHVGRAVKWLNEYDVRGDVLVFLPGEREIRETAEKLEGMNLSRTRILPLFARLGLADQQRIFHSDGTHRRIVLATNVAETSLTIPGIVYVVDSGLARISRYSAARQVQRLQIEEVSQASARQRAGRCGRVCEGVCIRLYDEGDWEKRTPFTDPEIKRSSLAGVLLKMKDLGLPEIGEFPLPDPPSSKLVTEGYRTLREIGAIDKKKQLTPVGKKLARLPIDPRLGRMLLEANHERALPEMLVIVAGLNVMDPKERPSDVADKADAAHTQWRNEESDFLSMLSMWREMRQFREGSRWKRNQLRKWCAPRFLNMMRLIEWSNLHEDLSRLVRETLRCRIPELETEEDRAASFAMIHRSILAGVPRQFGFWNPEMREYKGAGGRSFGIFPGSGLFKRKKRLEWIMGVELVETSRLWMRRCAKLDPAWVEQVAPQLCEYHYANARWDKAQGAVYGTERVVCGGLTILDNRRVHYGRINPEKAREIMIREGLLVDGFREKPPFLQELEHVRDEIKSMEIKLRRPDQVWCEDGVFEFYDKIIPHDICTEKAFQKWRRSLGAGEKMLNIRPEDAMYSLWSEDELDGYPDEIVCEGQEYPVYYQFDPGAGDDGVTLGVHIDQMEVFPDWLPEWGVPGNMAARAEMLLRTLPKDIRVQLQPMGQRATAFAALRKGMAPDGPLAACLAEFVEMETGKHCGAGDIDMGVIPPDLTTKVWVCDDAGRELAMGTDVDELRRKLKVHVDKRFSRSAAKLWSRTGMKTWECGELPLREDVGSRPGFVALTDEGNSTGIRVFPTEREAEASHRQGCMRLAFLAIRDQINYLKKKFPLGLEGKLSLGVIGVHPGYNLDDLLMVSLEGALGLPLPRNGEEFASSLLRARQNLFDAARTVGEFWEQWCTADHAIRDFTSSRGGERYFDRIAADLREQMNWLEREHFILKTGWNRLPDMIRYARGITERMRRMEQQPIVRELERMDQFHEAASRWPVEQTSHANEVAWEDYGYLLEEYRLVVFAPQLAVKGRVSVKKLEQARNMLEK